MEFERKEVKDKIHHKIDECFERERVLQKLIKTCFLELTDILMDAIEKDLSDERWRTGIKADASPKQETDAPHADAERANDAPAARKRG